jgi:hypothetical protein
MWVATTVGNVSMTLCPTLVPLRRITMPRTRFVAVSTLVLAALAVGCASSPPARGGRPASVDVIAADARALRYGATAPEVFANPTMGPKVQALFGRDWLPAAQGGGRLQQGAIAYFPASAPFRMLRIDGVDYVAISGCAVQGCIGSRGLLLIRADGEELWARLDEGGFSHYYGHGPGLTNTRVSPTFIDSAWRAVERVERA